MNITLIKVSNYKDKSIMMRLMVYDTKLDIPIDSDFRIDWNWIDRPKLTGDEKQQIESFIKQYLFDKLRAVV